MISVAQTTSAKWPRTVVDGVLKVSGTTGLEDGAVRRAGNAGGACKDERHSEF